MRYVLRNIKNLIIHEKFIFVIMLICVFSSAWIMTFSYGLYQNYFSLRAETEMEGKELDPEVIEGASLTKGDLIRYFGAISDETLNKMDIIYCSGSMSPWLPPGVGLGSIPFRFIIDDGIYKTSPYILDIWQSSGLITSGRYISDEEEASGAKVVLINQSILDTQKMIEEAERNGISPPESNIIDFMEATSLTDSELTLWGETYTVIGVHSSFGIVIVPFLSLPDDFELGGIGFTFKNNITNLQYNELVEQANAVIPGKLMFPEMSLPDEESIYLYNNIMLISALIAALTIINFAFLYNFIFQKRRRQLAVMRICGCTGFRALWIYLTECIIICIPTFLIGIAAYIPFMHGVLSRLFIYMEASYSPAIYITIFAIYVVVLFVIMGAMLLRQIKRETVQAWKGGVN